MCIHDGAEVEREGEGSGREVEREGTEKKIARYVTLILSIHIPIVIGSIAYAVCKLSVCISSHTPLHHFTTLTASGQPC